MIDTEMAPRAETSGLPAQPESLPAALLDLVGLLAQGDPQRDDWSQLAALVGRLLGADFCCVVVRDRGARDRLRISTTVGSGPLSVAARRALIRGSSVIRRLLSTEPAGAAAALAPLHESTADRQALYLPIEVDGAISCVVHVRRDGPAARPYSEAHAACARLVAALIGNALHLTRLQGLLQSNYAQLALMRGGSEEAPAVSLADPEGLVLRMARSFYRELRNAHFDERQVIGAASEVIAQLSQDLRARKDTRAGAKAATLPLNG